MILQGLFLLSAINFIFVNIGGEVQALQSDEFQDQNQDKEEAITAPYSGEIIRLRGENGSYNTGILEEYRNGHWSVACDTWDSEKATVACKQLGFKHAKTTSRSSDMPEDHWDYNNIDCSGESNRVCYKFKDGLGCSVYQPASLVCQTDNECPDDWISGHGSCYKFFEDAANISEASSTCHSLTARLVRIDSTEKHHFLSHVISSQERQNHIWYTSGRKSKGQWHWRQGEFISRHEDDVFSNKNKGNARNDKGKPALIDLSRWFPGWVPSTFSKEPSVTKGHNCLVLSDIYDLPNGTTASANYYFFKAARCNQRNQKISFICEISPKEQSQEHCGLRKVKNIRHKRIVGGYTAVHGESPWQVGLASLGSDTDSLTFRCGGVILDKHWVLTAAHCFDESIPMSELRLLIGDHNRKLPDEGEQTFQVEKLIIHENYSPYSARFYGYDLALLKVNSEDGQGIKMNKFAQPACLPAPGTVSTPSMPQCMISGWGARNQYEYADLAPLTLQLAFVPLVSYDDCNRSYNNSLPGHVICAGYSQGGIDTCHGDSGGPLVCQINGVYTLFGVTSWGYECAEPNYPGVYTNVAEFVTWIEDKMGRHSV